MAEAFSDFRYFPVDLATTEWPAKFTGAVFTNEFFDALPVDAAVCRQGLFHELLVGCDQDRFLWVEGPALKGEHAEFARRYFPKPEDGMQVEITLEALRWLERIAQRLERGYVLTIDYGYTAREAARHRRGTLMSYRRHTASEDVLAEPGERDITAHVMYEALQDHGASLGLETVSLEPMARTLLTAGEPDQFAAALAAATPAEELRRRLQLKTLLFEMGETFRTLLQRKTGGQ
jgi:SAM-dependent MidA family methyltransferase